MDASTKAVLIAAGLGVTAYVLYRSAGQVGQAAGKVGTAINPLNPDNVFAGAVNKVGATLSGDDSFSLGGWLFDLTHPTSTSPAPSVSTLPIDFGIGTGWDVAPGASWPLGQL